MIVRAAVRWHGCLYVRPLLSSGLKVTSGHANGLESCCQHCLSGCTISRNLSVSGFKLVHRSEVSRYAAEEPAEKGPTPGQLEEVYLKLSEQLPAIFVAPMDYRIYSPDIIFEDNVRNVRTRGIQAYVMNMSTMKILSHVKYSHIRMNVLKITQHSDDFTVRVRWRVVGVPGLFSLKFLKSRAFRKPSDDDKDRTDWIDGFSVFYLNHDGKIGKHVAEKIMPDDEKSTDKSPLKMAAKLGLLFGLMPQGAYNNDEQESWLKELLSLFF
ncbi:Uncharacterized protein HDE_06105 [Halotydeus destructor]|nr:Uncharacterized protein HDE_06105 [Halotydeus destructor]